MKKYTNLLLVLFLSSICFGSCSDDDDKTNYAKDIEGTYVGTTTVNEQSIPNVEIKITRKSTNKVTLSMNQDLGVFVADIEFESDVLYAAYTYAITSTVLVNIPASDVIPDDIEMIATVVGRFTNDGDLQLVIDVQIPGNPMRVLYEGNKE
ncbi:MAG: hypothetical protein LBV43_11610 [Prevotella sp.]|jgi:hypothetical protein|nr:hypothetical protein [Prevotella sp.]